MTDLELLRKDPTSRFYGVPKDLTQMIGFISRSLAGRPQRLHSLKGWKALGFTSNKELVIQSEKHCVAQVVSLPDLTTQRTIDIPRCQKLWSLTSGEIVSFLEPDVVQFSDVCYYIHITENQPTQLGPDRRSNTSLFGGSNVIDVSPEGKVYLASLNNVTEYNLMTSTSRILYSGSQISWLKFHQDRLYSQMNSQLVIYDLVSLQPISIQPNSGSCCLTLDPTTSRIFYFNLEDNSLYCQEKSPAGCHRLVENIDHLSYMFISSTSYLITVSFASGKSKIQVYG